MPTLRYKTGARFRNRPKTLYLDSGWQLLLEPLDFDIGAEVTLSAPKYSLTDGPSIPWFVQWLVPRKQVMRMGFLHDALRSTLNTSNFATDGLMLDAALACGLPYWRAFLAFVGVRIGTLIGYKSKPKNRDICDARIHIAVATGAALHDIKYLPKQSRFIIKPKLI